MVVGRSMCQSQWWISRFAHSSVITRRWVPLSLWGVKARVTYRCWWCEKLTGRIVTTTLIGRILISLGSVTRWYRRQYLAVEEVIVIHISVGKKGAKIEGHFHAWLNLESTGSGKSIRGKHPRHNWSKHHPFEPAALVPGNSLIHAWVNSHGKMVVEITSIGAVRMFSKWISDLVTFRCTTESRAG